MTKPSTVSSVSRSARVACTARALVCVLAGAVALACEEKEKSAAPPAPPNVDVVDVVQRDVPIYRDWVGTTLGEQNAEIRGQVSGYLIKQDYRDGTFVKKGDPLFEIDSRPFEAALMQAKGQLEQARGQLALAKSQVDQQKAQLAKAEADAGRTAIEVGRLTPLDNAVQTNAANDALVESGKATIKAAEYNVTAQEANVAAADAFANQAKLNLEFTKITAPIDGVAGIAQAQIGDLVGPQTGIVLTSISTIDPIKVTFPISEQEFMRAADRVAELEKHPSEEILELIMSDGSVFSQKGRINVADRQVDPRTGTITVQGIFKNPGSVLRPGQFARIRAQIRTMKGALLVPQRCVNELQGQYQIAVVGSDSKVAIRNVKIGERVGSMWIILDGLKPGERVVSEGIQKARAGTVVNATVVPAEGAPKSPAGSPPGSPPGSDEKGAAPPKESPKPGHKEGDAKPDAKKNEAK